jgi:signal transduction histidine kinase
VTRRILLVLLGFTAVIITGALVPLALKAMWHDQASFTEATAGIARTDAAVAQTRLDYLYAVAHGKQDSGSADNAQGDAPLVTVLNQARQAGDGLLILTSSGHVLSGKGMPRGNWSELATEADQDSQLANRLNQPIVPVIRTVGSRQVAAIAVYQRGAGPLVGTVLLARSMAQLNHGILTLWIILGTISVVAMIAAAVLAFALARWVSRPLAGLDSAAGRLAEGDLAIRAVVDSGPPELRRLATTFNTMAGRLEALVHGNRAVIADVSHQLRTPLAALRLRLDLLAADPDPDPETTRHELAGAQEELARLSRLVDGLLAVARAENVVPVPTAVDVAEVARERVVAWHPVADDRGITLEATSGGRSAGPGRAAVLAWIGEGHLEQVLDNLIANALDALGAGGRITVTTMVTTAGAQITVADDGPGMSAEDRERAFLRFTTSNPNGTGLGLAIVHRLVTSNGGMARLTETPGGGLTVVLDFPGVPTANGGGAPESASSAQDFISL